MKFFPFHYFRTTYFECGPFIAFYKFKVINIETWSYRNQLINIESETKNTISETKERNSQQERKGRYRKRVNIKNTSAQFTRHTSNYAFHWDYLQKSIDSLFFLFCVFVQHIMKNEFSYEFSVHFIKCFSIR